MPIADQKENITPGTMKAEPQKETSNAPVKLETQHVNVYFGDNQALSDVTMKIPQNSITAFIGPSGCGKSTFLRLFNRMNDYIDVFKKEGSVFVDNKDIYQKDVKIDELRKKVGMVFQKPNPFPKSIYDNVAYGLRIQGIKKKSVLDDAVERSLKQAALWEEVKNKLKQNALALSGGQQQRLCIARSLAVEPSVILMDEPASALDPISTSRIEELIYNLKSDYTIVVVTHNMHQASRISDNTGFFYMGELVEYDDTRKMFTNPENKRTENYITGKFG